ncbi:TetR/AcrR family transcriptional regulator [Actinomadura sp. 9N407]|uniref:TetR/AcrR family transcriptional regulator n=1 Tax=Actinomadura sp. 9N407 TaxID=3375154 RepID=UPI003793AE68
MAPGTNAARTRRSRISPDREAQLFGLVLEQLREVGYETFSVEAVAARARMSKATIYRQWGAKPDLVIAAVRSLGKLQAHIDTGTLIGDLKAYVDRFPGSTVLDREMNRAMAQAIHRDPRLMAAFREHFVKPGLLALEALLTRSIARGELATDCKAIPYVKNMLLGALGGEDFFGDTFDTAFLHGYVDHVIAPALGLPPSVSPVRASS